MVIGPLRVTMENFRSMFASLALLDFAFEFSP